MLDRSVPRVRPVIASAMMAGFTLPNRFAANITTKEVVATGAKVTDEDVARLYQGWTLSVDKAECRARSADVVAFSLSIDLKVKFVRMFSRGNQSHMRMSFQVSLRGVVSMSEVRVTSLSACATAMGGNFRLPLRPWRWHT